MIPASLCDYLEAHGLVLVKTEQGICLRGGTPNQEALDELRAQRETAWAEWEERRLARGWGKAPPAALPLAVVAPSLNAAQADWLESFVIRQPEAVRAWVMSRSNQYWLAVTADQTELTSGSLHRACDLRACVDVVRWQFLLPPGDLRDWILNHAANDSSHD